MVEEYLGNMPVLGSFIVARIMFNKSKILPMNSFPQGCLFMAKKFYERCKISFNYNVKRFAHLNQKFYSLPGVERSVIGRLSDPRF